MPFNLDPVRLNQYQGAQFRLPPNSTDWQKISDANRMLYYQLPESLQDTLHVLETGRDVQTRLAFPATVIRWNPNPAKESASPLFGFLRPLFSRYSAQNPYRFQEAVGLSIPVGHNLREDAPSIEEIDPEEVEALHKDLLAPILPWDIQKALSGNTPPETAYPYRNTLYRIPPPLLIAYLRVSEKHPLLARFLKDPLLGLRLSRFGVDPEQGIMNLFQIKFYKGTTGDRPYHVELSTVSGRVVPGQGVNLFASETFIPALESDDSNFETYYTTAQVPYREGSTAEIQFNAQAPGTSLNQWEGHMQELRFTRDNKNPLPRIQTVFAQVAGHLTTINNFLIQGLSLPWGISSQKQHVVLQAPKALSSLPETTEVESPEKIWEAVQSSQPDLRYLFYRYLGVAVAEKVKPQSKLLQKKLSEVDALFNISMKNAKPFPPELMNKLVIKNQEDQIIGLNAELDLTEPEQVFLPRIQAAHQLFQQLHQREWTGTLTLSQKYFEIPVLKLKTFSEAWKVTAERFSNRIPLDPDQYLNPTFSSGLETRLHDLPQPVQNELAQMLLNGWPYQRENLKVTSEAAQAHKTAQLAQANSLGIAQALQRHGTQSANNLQLNLMIQRGSPEQLRLIENSLKGLPGLNLAGLRSSEFAHKVMVPPLDSIVLDPDGSFAYLSLPTQRELSAEDKEALAISQLILSNNRLPAGMSLKLDYQEDQAHYLHFIERSILGSPEEGIPNAFEIAQENYLNHGLSLSQTNARLAALNTATEMEQALDDLTMIVHRFGLNTASFVETMPSTTNSTARTCFQGYLNPSQNRQQSHQTFVELIQDPTSLSQLTELSTQFAKSVYSQMQQQVFDVSKIHANNFIEGKVPVDVEGILEPEIIHQVATSFVQLPRKDQKELIDLMINGWPIAYKLLELSSRKVQQTDPFVKAKKKQYRNNSEAQIKLAQVEQFRQNKRETGSSSNLLNLDFIFRAKNERGQGLALSVLTNPTIAHLAKCPPLDSLVFEPDISQEGNRKVAYLSPPADRRLSEDEEKALAITQLLWTLYKSNPFNPPISVNPAKDVARFKILFTNAIPYDLDKLIHNHFNILLPHAAEIQDDEDNPIIATFLKLEQELNHMRMTLNRFNLTQEGLLLETEPDSKAKQFLLGFVNDRPDTDLLFDIIQNDRPEFEKLIAFSKQMAVVITEKLEALEPLENDD